MGTTAEKLQRVLDSKNALKTSINNKGGNITDSTPFSQYATHVDSLTDPIEEVATTEDLDMADGNMVITPNEGQAFSSVTINKPDTMLPENIKKDVNIGGVVGTLESGSAEPPYTSIITNSGTASFMYYIPDENGILTENSIESGETITIKHYGLFTWYRNGTWSYSWGGITYNPYTYGTYYCIQTESVDNVYTLDVTTTSSGGAGA